MPTATPSAATATGSRLRSLLQSGGASTEAHASPDEFTDTPLPAAEDFAADEAEPETDQAGAEYGDPWTLTAKGEIGGLNEKFWAVSFSESTRIIFDPLDSTFYWFHRSGAKHGLWEKMDKRSVREELDEHIRLVGSRISTVSAEMFAKLLKNKNLDCIVDRLAGLRDCIKIGAFANVPHGVLYVANGRLEITRDGDIHFTEGDDRPADLMRTRLLIRFNPAAKPKRLRAWFERIFQGREDDVQALAKFFGACVYGSNRWKKMLFVSGKTNCGKGMIPLVAERLIGSERATEYETGRLGERFEMQRFIGRVLLRAADVDADFAMRAYADRLKQLTGFDPIRAELRYENSAPVLRGDKMIFAASNFPLKVRIGVDRPAWEERLVYLVADGESYEKDEQDNYFLENLFADETEASGILNFALLGLQDLLRKGFWERSEDQMIRLHGVMENSDTVNRWVAARLTYCANGEGVTSSEAWGDYFRWCKSAKVPAWPERQFQTSVKASIEDQLGKTQSHDCRRGDSQQRGWKGLAIVSGAPASAS